MITYDSEYLNKVLTTLAFETKNAIERGDLALRDDFNAGYADLNTKIAGLLDQDLANQIATIKELIDNLDGSVVQDLLALKGLAEQALETAISADTKADGNTVEIDKLKTLYEEYVKQQDEKWNNVNAAITAGESAIIELQKCCEDVLKLSDVEAMFTEYNDYFMKACSSAVDTFASIMRSYPANPNTNPVPSGDII